MVSLLKKRKQNLDKKLKKIFRRLPKELECRREGRL